jgi:hypothetical protein
MGHYGFNTDILFIMQPPSAERTAQNPALKSEEVCGPTRELVNVNLSVTARVVQAVNGTRMPYDRLHQTAPGDFLKRRW